MIKHRVSLKTSQITFGITKCNLAYFFFFFILSVICAFFHFSVQVLPTCLDDFLLPVSHQTAADLFAIGTQESTPSR